VNHPSNGESRRARIVVADDHAAVIERVIRELEPEFEILGTVPNGRAAVDAVTRLDPDVILLDISMPGLSGLEAARAIAAQASRTRIVFLTVHADPDFAKAALAAGGRGYVIKRRLTTDLVVAVRSALAGTCFVSELNDR
jgi:DNA-binding NarL/FixJ family response regulator